MSMAYAQNSAALDALGAGVLARFRAIAQGNAAARGNVASSTNTAPKAGAPTAATGPTPAGTKQLSKATAGDAAGNSKSGASASNQSAAKAGGLGIVTTAEKGVFALDERTTQVLNKHFERVGVDARDIRLVFGSGATRFDDKTGQIVLGDDFKYEGGRNRRDDYLLAHESAHYVQWRQLGKEGFQARYKAEWGNDPSNYRRPQELRDTPATSLNFVDSRYKLEALASQFGYSVTSYENPNPIMRWKGH
jgi:hypothetical protein